MLEFVLVILKKVNVMDYFLPCILADVSLNLSVEEKQLPKGDTWSVHKFGGTCVGSSQRIKNVADIIINDDSERKLVVVSAMSKVTDMMYDLIYKAQSRDEAYISALDAVLEKHSQTAHELLDGDNLASFLSQLNQDISNLKAMLRAIYIGNRHIYSLSIFVTLCVPFFLFLLNLDTKRLFIFLHLFISFSWSVRSDSVRDLYLHLDFFFFFWDK